MGSFTGSFQDTPEEEQPPVVENTRIILQALQLLAEQERQEEAEPEEQPELPPMKNNDQRKEWLRNYQSWGLWYEDAHIGVRYYRYEFDNGAQLIAEEYPAAGKRDLQHLTCIWWAGRNRRSIQLWLPKMEPARAVYQTSGQRDGAGRIFKGGAEIGGAYERVVYTSVSQSQADDRGDREMERDFFECWDMAEHREVFKDCETCSWYDLDVTSGTPLCQIVEERCSGEGRIIWND